MNILSLHARLYPLQANIKWYKETSDTDTLVFVIGIVALVLILVVISAIRKNSKAPLFTGASSSSGGSPRKFSGFALHRLASDIGLDKPQTKMLDFVFKTDNVTDVEESVNNPTLMDKHFKRAYRAIDQDSKNDTEIQEKFAVLFSTRNILEAGSEGGNIGSTRQVPDSTSAVLGIEGESYPVRVVTAKGEHLVVENPQTAMGAPIKVSRGIKVTISFFTKSNKGFSFESRVAETVEAKNGKHLELVHSSQIKRLSHRRFRRRQMVLNTTFYLVSIEGKKMIVDKRKLTATILDISIGGCSMKTNAPLGAGMRLKIEFTQGSVSGAALGQVLRTNRSGASTIMHIRFLKIPRKSMNTINALVYEYVDV